MRYPLRTRSYIAALLAGFLALGCGIVTSATPSVGPGPRGEVGVIGDPSRPQPGPPRGDGSTVEAVSGELWTIVTAQDHYHSLNDTYARSLSALEKAVDYSPGDRADVRIFAATESGFSALARRGRIECAVFVGSATPPRDYAPNEGQVGCNQP